ncbi:universal stress protein [Natronosalvus halobius]|uniref:universal stress protein n=1 Tax=Natronosalvus halobius TaxID=2953746 RepID=UPI0020A11449|nr:universal stress protein [Natronosalvus halobius]USZ72586.1 universal stress protein [Natronosalvus halobius]
MSLIVPFDGSKLAEAALCKATRFAAVFDEPILAITVIPVGNRAYAAERGWIDDEAAFDGDAIVQGLREQVETLCSDASFRIERVDRYAPSGTIAKRIRRIAREESASMVCIGSENAGRLVTSVSSVGSSVAADDTYDVLVVRRADQTHVETTGDTTQTNGPS